MEKSALDDFANARTAEDLARCAATAAFVMAVKDLSNADQKVRAAMGDRVARVLLSVACIDEVANGDIDPATAVERRHGTLAAADFRSLVSNVLKEGLPSLNTRSDVFVAFALANSSPHQLLDWSLLLSASPSVAPCARRIRARLDALTKAANERSPQGPTSGVEDRLDEMFDELLIDTNGYQASFRLAHCQERTHFDEEGALIDAAQEANKGHWQLPAFPHDMGPAAPIQLNSAERQRALRKQLFGSEIKATERRKQADAARRRSDGQDAPQDVSHFGAVRDTTVAPRAVPVYDRDESTELTEEQRAARVAAMTAPPAIGTNALPPISRDKLSFHNGRLSVVAPRVPKPKAAGKQPRAEDAEAAAGPSPPPQPQPSADGNAPLSLVNSSAELEAALASLPMLVRTAALIGLSVERG
jgi:hypothetical protein